MVGESGSGKTTLARLLLGLVDPDDGRGALPAARTCSALAATEREQFLREVQVIFQDPFEVYNPFYNVDHVLETPVQKFRLASSKRRGARR